MSKQKLELTWIGKDKQPVLEPRILIEDAEKSYGAKDTQNMLVHGDNLLALKALEQEYAGKVKCIYIDPPFNTGSAFEHYDDGIEHSIWLDLMSHRLKFLKSLLREDGAIFIHIDYNEEAYLRVLLDEVFGRGNFRNSIIVSRIKKNVKERDTVRALNFAHDSILFYAKSPACIVVPPQKISKKAERWHNFEAAGLRKGMDYDLFGCKPKEGNHWRWQFDRAQKAIATGILRANPSTGKPEYLIPASDFETMDTNWSDLTASSFNWKFPNGEKNEKLLQRIFGMATNPGDLVLDSFLGSGTTAAVAHKMGRRWIGIELGEHCTTHCLPRLKKVVDGDDKGGITEAVGWQGGGGFRYFELAPSLLNKDAFGNFVISKEYNPERLAMAVAKHEGFRFAPSSDVYWKQGQSTESDFIYVTTNMVTDAIIDSIHDAMQQGESLLICCKSFAAACKNRFPNITIKKIPQMLLGRCEFGVNDYAMPITSAPVADDDEEIDDVLAEEAPAPKKAKGKAKKDQMELF